MDHSVTAYNVGVASGEGAVETTLYLSDKDAALLQRVVGRLQKAALGNPDAGGRYGPQLYIEPHIKNRWTEEDDG